MIFNKGERIRLFEGGASRWEVGKAFTEKNLTFLKLTDRDDSITPPMIREATGVCINYSNRQADDWTVKAWRKEFIDACKAGSGNFAGIPEPVDFFYFKSREKAIPEKLRGWDPFFVYLYGEFFPVRPVNPKQIRGNINYAAFLKPFVYDLVYILRGIHWNHLVLRQLPLSSLRRLKSNNKYFVGEFLSICSQGESNYNSNIPFLCLRHEYCAPECFDAQGEVTPSTDIYALAKSALMFMGIRFDEKNPFPRDITPYLDKVESRYSFPLPDNLKRFFKLAMAYDPKRRFQSVNEALAMFAGKPFTPPARTRGQKRNFPKANQKRETGVVKFYNDEKGFGFIKREGGKDLFVHINRVKKSKYQGLEKGDQVDFVVGKGYQGPEAQSVTVLNRVQNRKRF